MRILFAAGYLRGRTAHFIVAPTGRPSSLRGPRSVTTADSGPHPSLLDRPGGRLLAEPVEGPAGRPRVDELLGQARRPGKIFRSPSQVEGAPRVHGHGRPRAASLPPRKHLRDDAGVPVGGSPPDLPGVGGLEPEATGVHVVLVDLPPGRVLPRASVRAG